jgi:VPDSG-CTERM motif
MKINHLAAILIGIAGVALQQAKADTITLGVPNPALSGYNEGPYATANITVAGNGLSATVTFTSVVNSEYVYFMGDGGSVALNVNGSFSLSNLAASNSFSGVGFHPPAPVNAGPGNDDGFGQFTLRLNTGAGYVTSATMISFTVTNTSGTAWTGVTGGLNPFLLANHKGYFAASHIFVGLLTNLRQGAQCTGYAGNGTVPDGGATAVLLGMALAAMGVVRRYLTS